MHILSTFLPGNILRIIILIYITVIGMINYNFIPRASPGIVSSAWAGKHPDNIPSQMVLGSNRKFFVHIYRVQTLAFKVVCDHGDCISEMSYRTERPSPSTKFYVAIYKLLTPLHGLVGFLSPRIKGIKSPTILHSI